MSVKHFYVEVQLGLRALLFGFGGSFFKYVARDSEEVQDSACHQGAREMIIKDRVTELILVMIAVRASSTRRTVQASRSLFL